MGDDIDPRFNWPMFIIGLSVAILCIGIDLHQGFQLASGVVK